MFLIWLDILGFEKFLSEVASNSRINEKKVRIDFISTINNKITELKKRKMIVNYNYGKRDDWILVADSIDNVMLVIESILDHNTGYKDYIKMPLEIGIGCANFSKDDVLDDINLISENDTITFLKSYIVSEYRKYYKKNSDESIKETFVVVTKDFYKELNTLDNEYFNIIDSGSNIFYQIDTDFILEKASFLRFLSILNIDSSTHYSGLSQTFVKPKEYENIINLLDKENVVFIVGDPEIGKTFTSLYILWVFYKMGYAPSWIRGHSFSNREQIREIMSEGKKLVEYSIIYFEDPFGKTQYEDTEAIKREIGTFVNLIKNRDIKTIFTSRMNIFNQFLRVKTSEENLRDLSLSMLLVNPSYENEEMKQILINWSKYFNVSWLHKEELKNNTVKNILKNLHTPLSIRDFVIESVNVMDYEKILSIINKKSKEVKNSFAEEISGMNYERILFLSLNYILFSIERKEVKDIYYKLCKKYELNSIINDYDSLSNEFKYKIYTSDRTEFTHPSYEDGLVESWKYKEIQHFIYPVFNFLSVSDNPIVRGLVGFCLTKNFGQLDVNEETNEIILSVLKDKKAEARYGVANAASYYHKDLPLSFKVEMIESLMNDRNREIRAQAINMIGKSFDILPYDLTTDIIKKGIRDKAARVRLETVTTVSNHIKLLPKKIVLEALDEAKKLTNYSGWYIRYFSTMFYHAFYRDVQDYNSTSEDV